VKVWPATVSVPLRACVEPFVAALKLTVPLPEPLAPLVIVSHPALLVAVHAHPLVAVTAVDPVPPAPGTDWLVGEIENVQPAAA